jgi:two-component system chemotaxis response regulator CheB
MRFAVTIVEVGIRRSFTQSRAMPQGEIPMSKSEHDRIVVIGASAGGMRTLENLVAQLPRDFPAPVFIVNHMSPETTGVVLVNVLDKAGPLPCQHATDKHTFEKGQIYVAPSDRHMLIQDGHILITKGARENRSRPAIDPLFRSAAVAYGDRVIGVILTGYLDDGTSGMMAVKRCGGTCIAQDPDDAAHAEMPRSVILNVGVDHCVPIADMGALLSALARETPGQSTPTPEDIVIEARIAQRVLSDLPSVETLGDQVPFNCPECGGVLWQIKDGDILRYRCHTGHAYTSAVLLAEQSARIEETLWTALRMFEERQNLLKTMNLRREGKSSAALTERSNDAQVHIDRIRAMLRTTDTAVDFMSGGGE